MCIRDRMDVIHSELSSGGNVSLIGFGVFSVADRKARMARNPKTGEEMEVKARKIPEMCIRDRLRSNCKIPIRMPIWIQTIRTRMDCLILLSGR